MAGDFDEKTSVVITGAKPVASALPRSPCFVVIAGTEAGRLYKVQHSEAVIGRMGGGADLEFADASISRRHAKISVGKDGQLTLEDLGSTNGTYCNGDKVKTRVLHDGDHIQVGSTTILKFSIHDAVEEGFLRHQYELATRDELTGCYNKKYFSERLQAELAAAKRHTSTVSLAMMDIDFFKKINDAHGHLAGDHVLRTLGKLLVDTCRADDLMARYGGEEFALWMRETDQSAGILALERLRKQIAATRFEHKGKPLSVTLSFGLATFANDLPDTAEALIDVADKALYAAKRNGRDRIEVVLL